MHTTFVTYLTCRTCSGSYSYIGIPKRTTELGCPHCTQVLGVSENFTIQSFHDVPLHPQEVDADDSSDDYPEGAIFTDRQRDWILNRLVKGKPNKDVASTMGVSVPTVHKHASNSRKRMQAYLEGTDADLDLNGGADLKKRMLESYQRKYA